ncbi:MAG: TIM barrel protein [Pseudomonadota bacterium]|nr:TIM barrel protein [Pseudomonadota bacterium]
MPRLAANIDWLFTELPFAERFGAARAAGFDAVEILFPYDHDPDVLAAAREAAGTEVVLVNTPAPYRAAGDIGCAADPARRSLFRSSIERGVEMARRLGAPRLHAVAGKGNVADPAARACFVENMRLAADLAADSGLAICIEPINTVDWPGFYLSRIEQALDLLADIDRPEVRLQFDFYHAQIMGGDLERRFRAALPVTGHIQIANPPGRNEPGVGEIDYDHVLGLVDQCGYDGPVSLEYRPLNSTLDSLAWFRNRGLLPPVTTD